MNPKKIILIVDDDADDIEMFVEAVQEVDPDIICLSNRDGKDALDYLKSGKTPIPNLIFLDLNMPRLNGIQCLCELKKIKGFASVPIVIYTTAMNLQDEAEVKNLGAALFITKPTRFEDICNAVKSCLIEYDDQIDS